jgi:hypothetical protein
MTDAPAPENMPLGNALLMAGWYQGAVFNAPPISFACNDVADPASGEASSLQIRKLKSREKLVLLTQDCDILSGAEPYVEAMICVTEKKRDFLERIDRNSSRWFVIDPENGLVAEAKYRVQISKKLLETLKPEPWPGHPERLRRFIRWLGRRYDRPAIEDEIVEVFQKPLEKVFERLLEEQPALVATFNRAVHEVRVNIPLRESIPFDLHLILLTKSEGLSEEEADAIDDIIDEIVAIVDPGQVELDETRILSAETMSVAEYFGTRPIFLEYHSYQGDEVTGAEPLNL